MARQPRSGGIVQRRAQRADGWTNARKAAFLGGLAASCNVKATCRELSIDSGSAYKRRAFDPEFAAQWDWALQQGYVRLEGELLASAMSSDAITAASAVLDNRPEASHPVDTELALKLLALRDKVDSAGRRAAGRFVQPSRQQTLQELDRLLTRMEKRLGMGK